MGKLNKEEDYSIYTETPDLNERIYSFAKNNDLIHRLKLAEDSLVQYGSSIQKIFQLGYLEFISKQLNKDLNSNDFNDISNFKEILSSDYGDILNQFIKNLNEEQEINPSFFLKFSKLVNSPYLKERSENRVKQYLEMHNLNPGIHDVVRFCSNDHLDYYQSRQDVKGLYLFN